MRAGRGPSRRVRRLPGGARRADRGAAVSRQGVRGRRGAGGQRRPRAVLDRLLSAKVKRRRTDPAAALAGGLGPGGRARRRDRCGPSPVQCARATRRPPRRGAVCRRGPEAAQATGRRRGRRSSPPSDSAPRPPPTPDARRRCRRLTQRQARASCGSRATDGSIRAAVTALPGEGGTKVKVVLPGWPRAPLPAGRDRVGGTRETAGNWIVDTAAYDGRRLRRTTTIPPEDISTFEIATAEGRVLLIGLRAAVTPSPRGRRAERPAGLRDGTGCRRQWTGSPSGRGRGWDAGRTFRVRERAGEWPEWRARCCRAP